MAYTEKVDPAIVHWVFLLIGSKFAKCNAFNAKKQLLNMPHHLFNWDSIGIEPNKLEGQGQQFLDLPFWWPVKRSIVLICLSICFDLQAMLFLRLLRLSTWDRNFTNTNAFAKNIIIIEMLRHHKSEIFGHIMTKLALKPVISNSADPAVTLQPSLLLLFSLCCSHSTANLLHSHSTQSLCTRSAGIRALTTHSCNAFSFYFLYFRCRLCELSENSISFHLHLHTCLPRGSRRQSLSLSLLSLDGTAHRIRMSRDPLDAVNESFTFSSA